MDSQDHRRQTVPAGFVDTFIFRNSANGGGGFDRTKDFGNGTDVIELSPFGFVDFTTNVLSLTKDRATGLKLSFGGGDILFIEGLTLADFDASDVILALGRHLHKSKRLFCAVRS